MVVAGPLFALVTPFAEEADFAVDEAALRASLKLLLGLGVRDVVSCGTTGEFCSMVESERRRVTEIVAEEVHARQGNVICHISACDTKTCIGLAQHAKRLNCAAVLLLPPYYFHDADPRGVEGFFSCVLSAIDIPCFLYNFPKHTGNSIAPDMYARLAAKHANIAGMKDSSGTLELAKAFAAAAPALRVFVGNDKAASQVYSSGLAGSITGACTGMPEPLLALAQAKDSSAAAEAQGKIDEWHGLLEEVGGAEIAKVKACLAARLSHAYPIACRPPLVSLDSEQVGQVRAWIRRQGLAAD